MHNPLVSIVIGCYNHSEFITETINSIIDQSYPNWECIIVDDGSTDNSSEIIKTFVHKEERIKYIYQNNAGISVARNNGINNAKGIYILTLDSDDKIAKMYLEKAVDVFQKDNEVKLVYAMADMFGEINSPWILPSYEYKELLIGNMIIPASFFKREDFNATTGYDPLMRKGIEDWEFWIRFLGPKDKVYRINETLFYYRTRSVSRNNTINTEAQKNLRRQIFNNNFDKYCAVIGEPLDIYALNKRVETLEKKLKSRYSYKLRMFIKRIGRSFKH